MCVACGPKNSETESATGDTTGDPSGSTTEAPETTGEPTSTGASSTGAPSCEVSPEDELGAEVKVLLRNAGDATIWVDRRLFCGEVLPFAIFDPAGEEVNPSIGLCEFTCEEILMGNCGCPAGCGSPDQVIQIDPGATFEIAWSGEHWAPFPLTEECANGCDLSCLARQVVQPGVYKFVARSSSLLTDCEDCSCTPNADGWCQMDGNRDGEEVVVEGTLNYPAQTEITLVFP